MEGKAPEELGRENDQLVDAWAADVKAKRAEEYETDGMMRTAIIAIARYRQAHAAALAARDIES